MDYKNTPLWKELLPLKERIDYLVDELTLEEKIQCICIQAPEIKRLGILPFAIGGEAAHGVEARHDQEFNKGLPVETTVFTQPIGMSATWDTELMEKVGVVVGTEARAIYHKEGKMGLSRWGPTIDMERDPRWGRTEEGYGEDPYLTGKMSASYIQGLQGRDHIYIRCAATLKHFYANNEEKDREKSSSSLDARNKQEYYLEPFRRAIMEGKAEAVMTSYNEINGIPAIVNPEVQELLKDTWGLKGHVVCDMGDLAQTVTKHGYVETDAQTLALGLKAGVDSFNDPDEIVIAAAKEALRLGLITEEDLNRSIRNTFSTKLRLGLYDTGDQCPYSAIGTDQLNCQEHKDICLEVAKKAVILLKNEKQMLPINNTAKKSIAVVGLLADACNKDWYSGIPQTQVTPWKAFMEEFPSADLSFSDGIDRIKICVGEQYLAVQEDGSCYLSDTSGAEVFEHTDWGDNKHTLRAVSIGMFLTAGDKTGNILAKKEEVFSWFVQESFSFHEVKQGMEDTADEFTIEAWNHKPIYLNEEGRLVLSENKSTDQIEDDENRCENNEENMSEDTKEKTNKNMDKDAQNAASQKGSIFTFKLIRSGIAHAAELAKTADTVIAVIGCHPIISSKEDVDRSNTHLPAEQRRLLQNLKSVNPNVVLVLITNYPYAIEWEKENLPVILITASGSQDLGTAIAKVISGEYSPAGRLNMTWYQGSEDLPPMREYDIIQGKRTYQYFDGKVIYPFGYGLSYTEFLYHDLQVKQENDQLEVSLFVENVGTYDSDEVVQLYISQVNSRTTRPIKALKGFHRISVKAGEEMPILFHLPCSDLRYYDVVTGAMVLEDSDYKIQAGASSEDIRLETMVHVAGTVIASRDMTKIIPCDHYDSYENIYLHLGHDNKPGMLPKTILEHQKPRGIAVYNNVSFKSIPSKFVIDVKAEEQGILIIRFGDRKIAEVSLDVMEDFKQMEVLINSFEFEPGDNRPLQIEIQGKIRVVEFFFQT